MSASLNTQDQATPGSATQGQTSVGKINLFDYPYPQLQAFFVELGEQGFRAKQLMKWVYHQGVTDFAQMTDLSAGLRTKLSELAEIREPTVVSEQISNDGTRKWLLRMDQSNSIETVFIPEADRGTLCISSQVGCALDCSFCATGREGFNRNLSTAEIISQVWMANKLLKADNPGSTRVITNVVLMGMGEPLLNFKNVTRALEIMLDDLGYGLSKRRVTVSTAGVVPKIDALKEAVDVSLAVSLHASNDELRNELVPVNKTFPLAELLAACKRYVQGDRKKVITFEYVMLDGVNDSIQDAKKLVKILADIPTKLNLIPFNSFGKSGYSCSSDENMNKFQQYLLAHGVRTIIRKTRGEDIDAACGQLAGKITDRSRRERKFQTLRFGEKVA